MSEEKGSEEAFRGMMLDSTISLEESIQFWCRNDFLLVNCLLMNDVDGIKKLAPICYNDNEGVLSEYEKGIRQINSPYDIKWVAMLKKRLPQPMTEEFLKCVVDTARVDANNIFYAMKPSGWQITAYRFADFSEDNMRNDTFSYAYQYKELLLSMNKVIDINIISSAYTSLSLREDETAYILYRIHLRQGSYVLELNPFEFHNERDEILLPPMKCKITGINITGCPLHCRAVIDLYCIEQVANMAFTENENNHV